MTGRAASDRYESLGLRKVALVDEPTPGRTLRRWGSNERQSRVAVWNYKPGSESGVKLSPRPIASPQANLGTTPDGKGPANVADLQDLRALRGQFDQGEM